MKKNVFIKNKSNMLKSTFHILKSTIHSKFNSEIILNLKSNNKEEKTTSCKPAIYNKEALSRVVKCGFNRSLESEIEKLNSKKLFLQETEEYELKNAIIAGGKVFTEKGFYFLSKKSSFEAVKRQFKEFKNAHLINSTQGLRYFGHWLRDDCALYEKLNYSNNLISLARSKWPDCKYYESAFKQTWQEVNFAHIESLTLYRDLGFSLDKEIRIRKLRSRLRDSEKGKNSGKIVYISRGELGDNRDMVNKDEIEKAFKTAGIEVVEPARNGYSIVPEILDASIIISIEGSQLSHAVYSIADKGSLIVLQPPERFYNPHIEWCRLIEINYGIVIGEKTNNGFKISPNEVFHMIDQLQKL